MRGVIAGWCGLLCWVGFAGCASVNQKLPPGFDAGAATGPKDMAFHFRLDDLALPGDDLAQSPQDLSIVTPGNGSTGDPCTAAGDCLASVAGANVTPRCILSGLVPAVPYPGGYCSSPCRAARSDPTTGLNSDCPSDHGACQLVSQTAGVCVAICMNAAQDCRAGYVCENNTSYAPSCQPKAADWCDPTNPNGCARAKDGAQQLCVDYSPDQSAGACAEICDVFRQTCPLIQGNPSACIADPRTGTATCLGTSGAPVGQPCVYLNECVAGAACSSQGGKRVCAKYCRQGGNLAQVACPNGLVCTGLSQTVAASVIGVCI